MRHISSGCLRVREGNKYSRNKHVSSMYHSWAAPTQQMLGTFYTASPMLITGVGTPRVLRDSTEEHTKFVPLLPEAAVPKAGIFVFVFLSLSM